MGKLQLKKKETTKLFLSLSLSILTTLHVVDSKDDGLAGALDHAVKEVGVSKVLVKGLNEVGLGDAVALRFGRVEHRSHGGFDDLDSVLVEAIPVQE
jgi:hypothetical protein